MALPLPGGPDPDPARQQKFDRIAQALIGTGGKSVELRFGADVATFTASTGSGIVTVTHGLGRAPVAVFALADTNAVNVFAQKNGAATTTTVPFSLTSLTAHTGNVTFYWFAIG